ncbi:unnamed protein product [Aureobasidium mustum]|uniref:25S rRNA (uridine-N(3))-methyltransferase BMT5-like domain-containing protein n=1 Tax=Aureobasidium mustum TaxID=2773714 RepID=A0A9N8K8U5_9PEZI|nr:unnamed protein product [Aureobasidium mustum]
MGKSKRRKLQERKEHNEKSNGGRSKFNVRDGPSRPKHQQSKSQQHAKPSADKKTAASAQKQQQQHQESIIPFDALDRILVIGDGDLSFSRSLVDTHGCAALLATTYDTEIELLEKYPQAQENKDAIEAEEQRVLHGAIKPLLAPHGTVIVTLFEGEPYTLWNIRDLARHSGLEVQRSFRFQADAYPGYSHARTLGNIEGGGGWKGEERLSRSYVFQHKGAGDVVQKQQAKNNKRKKVEESDDEDSDED